MARIEKLAEWHPQINNHGCSFRLNEIFPMVLGRKSVHLKMNSIKKIGKMVLTHSLECKPIETQGFRQITNVQFSKEKLNITEISNPDLLSWRSESILEDGSRQTTWVHFLMWSMKLGLTDVPFGSIVFDSVLEELKKIDKELNSRFEIPTHIITLKTEQTWRVNGDLKHDFPILREKNVTYTVYRITQTQERLIEDSYDEWFLKKMQKRERKADKIK
jgi:hypothetical protein